MRIFNEIYVICVSILHPDLQFIKYATIRTLLDTHRNQGILSVLLCVRGGAQPDVVKRHLLVFCIFFHRWEQHSQETRGGQIYTFWNMYLSTAVKRAHFNRRYPIWKCLNNCFYYSTHSWIKQLKIEWHSIFCLCIKK